LGKTGVVVRFRDYSEHAIGSGADAKAAAYVEVVAEDGSSMWGVGRDDSIVTASLRAVFSAVNRVSARQRREASAA
jgi:2-isopropylmalate synthase